MQKLKNLDYIQNNYVKTNYWKIVIFFPVLDFKCN